MHRPQVDVHQPPRDATKVRAWDDLDAHGGQEGLDGRDSVPGARRVRSSTFEFALLHTKPTFPALTAALRRMLNTTICSWYKATWNDPKAKVAIYAAYKDIDLFSRRIGAPHASGMESKQYIATPLQVAKAAQSSTLIHVIFDGAHYQVSRMSSACAALHTFYSLV